MAKWLCVILGISASVLAHANCCSGSPSFSGLYVGAAGGIANSVTDLEIASQASGIGDARDGVNTIPVLLQVDNGGRFKAQGYRGIGEAFVGWGCQWSPCFYFGVRFTVSYSRFELQQQLAHNSSVRSQEFDFILDLDDTLKTQLRSDEYSFDFKPGILICPRSMLFAIVGVSLNRSRIRGRSDLTYEQRVGIAFDKLEPVTLTVDDRRTRAAFRLGAGFEQRLSSCLTLHLTYIYTTYPVVSGSARAEFPLITLAPTSFEVTYSSRPTRHSAVIGLSYYL